MNTNSYLPDAMAAPLYARARAQPRTRPHTPVPVRRTPVTARVAPLARTQPTTITPAGAGQQPRLNYGDPELARWESSLQLDLLARRNRSDLWAQIVRQAVERIRRMQINWRQAREERETYEALAQLDNSTLKDLGLTRGELRSAAIKVAATRYARVADRTDVPVTCRREN